MATQALLSSSLASSVETARQILGARSLQSPIGSSRKTSFVVRAASTPPVKVPYFHFSSIFINLLLSYLFSLRFNLHISRLIR